MKTLRRIIITFMLFLFCLFSGCGLTPGTKQETDRFSFFPALFSSQRTAVSGRLTAQTQDSVYFFFGDERGEAVRGIYRLEKGSEPESAELVVQSKYISAMASDGKEKLYYSSIVASGEENKNKLIEWNLETSDYNFTYQVTRSSAMLFTEDQLYSLSYAIETAPDKNDINAYGYYRFTDANLAAPSAVIDTEENFRTVELNDMDRTLSYRKDGEQMLSYITKDDLQIYDLESNAWTCASNIYAPTIFTDEQTAYVQTLSRTGPLLEVSGDKVTEYPLQGESAHYNQMNYHADEGALVLFNTYNYFGNYQENEREYILRFDVREKEYSTLYEVQKSEIVLYADLDLCLIYDRQTGAVSAMRYGEERQILFADKNYIYGLEIRGDYAFFYYSAGLDECEVDKICLQGVYRLN